MKGFIGAPMSISIRRPCMASSVAGHRRAFRCRALVPGCYEDLDEADLLVLVGSNAAWCHPVLFQRMLANKQKRGARVVVIDPRRTDTGRAKPTCFRVEKPGTDNRAVQRISWRNSGRHRRARSRPHRASQAFGLDDDSLARAQSISGSIAADRTGDTGPWRPEVAAALLSGCSANTPRVVTLGLQGSTSRRRAAPDKVMISSIATSRRRAGSASPARASLLFR